MKPFFLHTATLLIALFSAQLYAANLVQITGVSGASNFELPPDATGITNIYGGIVGNTCVGASTTSTCNNCDGTGPCNTARIHSALLLTISFTVVADLTGTGPFKAFFAYKDSTGAFHQFGNYTPPTGLVKGSTATIQMPWSEICNVAGLANCAWNNDAGVDIDVVISVETSATFAADKNTSLRVSVLGNSSADVILMNCATGIDSGLCRFIAHAGDEKVYIDDLGYFDSLCPTEFKSIRMFYSPDSFAAATYGGASVDFPIDTSCNPVGDWIVEGLSNETPYFFRGSIVDVAKNNFFLTNPEVDNAVACPLLQVAPVAAAADDACDYVATPGLVDGLLPKDINCFIATAAYGTYFEPKLKVLRKFRSQILLHSEIGRSFVKFYYTYGPIAAKYISDKSNLRSITRAALWPVWGFAWLALHYGVSGALLIVLTLIGLTIFGVREWRWGDL